MPNVVVDGGVLRLTAAATWAWGISILGVTPAPYPPPPPQNQLGNYLDVTLSGTGTKVTEDGVASVLWADVVSSLLTVNSAYHTSICGLWTNNVVAGIDGLIVGANIITLIPTTVSTKMINIAVGVLLDNASGTFSVTPAVLTGGVLATLGVPSGPPTPDAVLPKLGTWAIQSHGQVGPSLVATS